VPSYAWGAREGGNCPLCTSPRYATDLGYSIVHRPFFAMAALCDGAVTLLALIIQLMPATKDDLKNS